MHYNSVAFFRAYQVHPIENGIFSCFPTRHFQCLWNHPIERRIPEIPDETSLYYGGWFMPCRINVFSGRKRERSPRENPPKGDFVGFSHGDLSPRQSKIRQTGGEKATHEKYRTFMWRGERSPCENTKSHHLASFRVAPFRLFAPKTR